MQQQRPAARSTDSHRPGDNSMYHLPGLVFEFCMLDDCYKLRESKKHITYIYIPSSLPILPFIFYMDYSRDRIMYLSV